MNSSATVGVTNTNAMPQDASDCKNIQDGTEVDRDGKKLSDYEFTACHAYSVNMTESLKL